MQDGLTNFYKLSCANSAGSKAPAAAARRAAVPKAIKT